MTRPERRRRRTNATSNSRRVLSSGRRSAGLRGARKVGASGGRMVLAVAVSDRIATTVAGCHGARSLGEDEERSVTVVPLIEPGIGVVVIPANLLVNVATMSPELVTPAAARCSYLSAGRGAFSWTRPRTASGVLKQDNRTSWASTSVKRLLMNSGSRDHPAEGCVPRPGAQTDCAAVYEGTWAFSWRDRRELPVHGLRGRGHGHARRRRRARAVDRGEPVAAAGRAARLPSDAPSPPSLDTTRGSCYGS